MSKRSTAPEFERRLRAQTQAAREKAPAALPARVMADLDRPPRGDVVAAMVRSPGGALAYATAAGLVMLVSVLAWTGRPEPIPVVVAVAEPSALPAPPGHAGVLPVIAIDSTPLRSAVERRVARIDVPWQAPLMAEARLVMTDAGRAADAMLARLPGRPIRVSRSEPRDAAPVGVDDADETERAFPWNRLGLP